MSKASFCSVEGCGNAQVACGYCDPHYRRWRRHGDPLAGRVHPGALHDYFTDVVLAYEGDECLPWPFSTTQRGYALLRIEGRTHLVSRLICEKVFGPAPTLAHQAAHSCGNGHLKCCTKRHLSWKTPVENSADKLIHGTHTRGEQHSRSKLTEAQARAVLSSKGIISRRELADIFSISQGQVARIHAGKSWGWLDA